MQHSLRYLMHLDLSAPAILINAFHVHRIKYCPLVVHVHYLSAVRCVDVVIVYVLRDAS